MKRIHLITLASIIGLVACQKGKMKAAQSGPVPISGNYYYMGGFTCGNYKGLPDYLESNGDHISQSFLNEVNASLPESKPVPTNNPSYLASSNELDVVVEEKSDVWVTFVTEGAGYRNTLGYYVFDSDNPPSSPAQIHSIFVIFPNASLFSGFINTRPGTTPVNPQTVSNGISFNTPQDQAKVGYNPFIYANGTRGREVHLAGKDATTLANSSLFGTGDDASNTNNGSTYQNAQNLPWAIHVKGNFKHPIEQTAITSAYNFFAQWATSGGTQYPDWYTDQSGYRNAAELY